MRKRNYDKTKLAYLLYGDHLADTALLILYSFIWGIDDQMEYNKKVRAVENWEANLREEARLKRERKEKKEIKQEEKEEKKKKQGKSNKKKTGILGREFDDEALWWLGVVVGWSFDLRV